jgi:hypothetical protein
MEQTLMSTPAKEDENLEERLEIFTRKMKRDDCSIGACSIEEEADIIDFVDLYENWNP